MTHENSTAFFAFLGSRFRSSEDTEAERFRPIDRAFVKEPKGIAFDEDSPRRFEVGWEEPGSDLIKGSWDRASGYLKIEGWLGSGLAATAKRPGGGPKSEVDDGFIGTPGGFENIRVVDDAVGKSENPGVAPNSEVDDGFTGTPGGFENIRVVDDVVGKSENPLGAPNSEVEAGCFGGASGSDEDLGTDAVDGPKSPLTDLTGTSNALPGMLPNTKEGVVG
jgi:hypothetical protein